MVQLGRIHIEHSGGFRATSVTKGQVLEAFRLLELCLKEDATDEQRLGAITNMRIVAALLDPVQG